MSRDTGTRSRWNPGSNAARAATSARLARIVALHHKGMTPREIAHETGEHTWYVNQVLTGIGNGAMGRREGGNG